MTGILFWYFWCVLLAELAALAFVEFATEALLYQVVQAVAEGFEAHLVNDLVDEGVLQQQLSLGKRYASLTHIEQGGIVELADGGTVGTLDIVGIDLEHRLGVHAGFAGGRQVLVGHLRGGLLGSLLHQDTACEGSCGAVVEHVLIQFAARAMGRMMSDERVVVDMLLLVGNDTTVAAALGTLA